MFVEMGPYILLGLLFVGIMNVWISKEIIQKQIGKDNYWSIFKAALLGVPLPLCSCGVIPTAVYMANNKASKPAVISFLISTPQTGIDSITATYGMMGPVFAIFRPFAALIMGVAGGIVSKYSNNGAKKEITNSNTKKKFNLKLNVIEPSMALESKKDSFYKKFLYYPYVEFLDDIAPQFIFGVVVAGLISYFIPDNYFGDLNLNSGFLGMLLMIVIGVPMYICATASIPIALALILKGFSPGVAFVFLAVGPATNVASLSILIKTLGKKVVTIYLITIILFSIALGYLLDFIFYYLDIDPISQIPSEYQHSHNIFDNTFYIILSVVLLLLLMGSIWRLYFKKYFNQSKADSDKSTTEISVNGMTCNHCERTVESAINKIPGTENIIVDHTINSVSLMGIFDIDKVKKAIKDSGYELG